MKKIIILSGALFLLFYLTSFSQDKFQLIFQPSAGLHFITEYDVSTIIRQEIMGIEQEIEMNMLMEMDNLVKSVEDSSIHVTTYYKRLAIETMTPSGRVQVDSDSQEDQIGKDFLKKITGRRFMVVFDHQGMVKEIHGLENIIQDITADISSENDQVQSYKNTLDDAFGQGNIKNSLNQMTPFFPEYPIGIHDSWDWDMNSRTAQFELRLKNTSIVKDASAERIIIQTNSNILTPENPIINLDGKNALLKMSGKQVSELYIQTKTGLTTEGVIKQDLNGELRIAMSDKSLETMAIPMKISTSISLRMKFK